jgi:hypothetical protein
VAGSPINADFKGKVCHLQKKKKNLAFKGGLLLALDKAKRYFCTTYL